MSSPSQIEREFAESGLSPDDLCPHMSGGGKCSICARLHNCILALTQILEAEEDPTKPAVARAYALALGKGQRSVGIKPRKRGRPKKFAADDLPIN